MFSITLYLAAYPNLSGCEALDFERAHGLPETGRRSRRFVGEKYQQQFPVPESFARAYFPADRLTQGEPIPVSLLSYGELVEAPPEYGTSDLCLSAALTPERAMALFVAARFHALSARLAETQKQDD